MEELAAKLEYEYRDLAYLIDAMDVSKTGNTSRPEYNSSTLALVGDAVLKLVISDYLYELDLSRGEITTCKSRMESNNNLYRISKKYNLCHYSYNESYFFDEAPQECKLPSGKHDLYVESIIGAVFHDLGYEGCREWVQKVILPEMQRETK